MNPEEKIQQYRKIIEEVKADKNRLQGKKEGLLSELNKLGINSLIEAEQEANKLEKEINSLRSEIEQSINDIEAKYDFS